MAAGNHLWPEEVKGGETVKTMIDILIENLPEGAEVKKVKEKNSKYEFDFCYGDYTERTDIFKTCAPGYEKNYVESSIAACMAGAMLAQNDIEGAKRWLEKTRRHDQQD